jgi:ornithine decarboxylase
VGSAARDPVAFSRGLDLCVSLVRGHRETFSTVHDRPGAPADAIVDIGGGFSADTFEQVARAIGQSSKQNSRGLRIVAEPGRYFAETACTLVAMVQGVRHRSRDPAAPDAAGARDRVSDYYISDGLYGSLNCVLYDNQRPAFSILRSPHLPAMAEADASPTSTATVWGPTCDSADKVLDGLQLPELRIGDFLVFHDAGAYTLAGACEFNGIQSNRPVLHYYDSS